MIKAIFYSKFDTQEGEIALCMSERDIIAN